MGRYNNLDKIDVVILCGGQGKRLRPVTKGLPKVLVNVGGRPFIDILISNLWQQGFKRFILCVGYLREQVIDHFKQNTSWNVEFSAEKTPSGTGGAVKKAGQLITSDSFLVMNGDSICNVDFSKFYDFHERNGGILSMVLAKSRRSYDYGIVELDSTNRIRNFKEKVCKNGSGMINAGIYLMKRDIFGYMPEGANFSLEHDLFPKIADSPCYGFLTDGALIDIGTPQRYEMANRLFYIKSGEMIF